MSENRRGDLFDSHCILKYVRVQTIVHMFVCELAVYSISEWCCTL